MTHSFYSSLKIYYKKKNVAVHRYCNFDFVSKRLINLKETKYQGERKFHISHFIKKEKKSKEPNENKYMYYLLSVSVMPMCSLSMLPLLQFSFSGADSLPSRPFSVFFLFISLWTLNDKRTCEDRVLALEQSIQGSFLHSVPCKKKNMCSFQIGSFSISILLEDVKCCDIWTNHFHTKLWTDWILENEYIFTHINNIVHNNINKMNWKNLQSKERHTRSMYSCIQRFM